MAAAHRNFVCRNCGGTQAKDSGDGMLHCTTCGMQTLAENAARHSPHTPPATPPRKTGLGWRRLLYIPMLFSLGLSGYYVVQAYRSGNLSQQIPNIFNPNGGDYRWTGSDHGVFVGKEGNPGLFIIGERHLNTGRAVAPGNGPHLIFYSLPNYAEVHSQKLKLPQLKAVGNRFEVRSADKGVFYALLNQERLLRINSTDFTFEDVTESLRTHPDLAGSIKKIAPLSGVQSTLFEVETSAGKMVYYNPELNKIFTSLAEPASNLKGVSATDTAVGFAFSRRNALYPDAPMQLIRYLGAKRESKAAPLPYFVWQRAPAAAPFNKAEKPVLNARGAVISFKDFSPGQMYHKARVLFWDTEVVLVVSFESSQADAVQKLQAIDAQTGAVRFTLLLTRGDYFTDAVRYPEGFLVKDAVSVLLISNRGELIKRIKTF